VSGPQETTEAFEEAYVFPVSLPQERLWFVEQLTPGLGAYNVSLAVGLWGPLDPARLARALSGVVLRHEALRTRFRTEDGHPVQVIAVEGETAVPLPLVDLRLVPGAAEWIGEPARLAALEAGIGFDLRRGPLLRARLLRLADERHALLLTLHHIVADRWSMGVLMGEVTALYQGRALPELPLQYADYAVWQREWLTGETLERQIGYWRERLAEVPALQLPADRRRPLAGGGGAEHRGGQVVDLELPAELAQALGRLALAEGATLFMVLLAGFLVVMARHSGQEDFAVGTAVANRPRAELFGMIGFFINNLALRTDLSGDPSFRELVGRVRETTLGAFAHQDLPFDRLVDELRGEGGSRAGQEAPLFDVTFLLQNTPLPSLERSEIELVPLPVELASVKYGLAVSMVEHAAGIGGAFEYDADLFERTTVERLAGHYRHLLAAAVEDPAAEAFGLPLVPGDEMAGLVAQFNRSLG
jgi:hypothetical protein